MKLRRLIILVALTALGVAPAELPAQQRDRRDRDRDRDAPSQQATTRPAPSGYNERYAVLEQRNVFVRDRSRPTTRGNSSASTRPAPRSAEESLVVTGIAMEELGYRAYVEDLNTGGTLRLSPGDPIARGYVAAVALDAIAYDHDGQQTWIEIGSDLTGKASAALSSSSPLSSSASATTSPTTLPANVDLNDPSLTIEQRMRLRVQLQNQRGQ